MREIPDNYRLSKAAEFVAKRMGLELSEAKGKDRQFYEAITSFANPTDHLIQLAIRRGQVEQEVVLSGERDNEALIHYTGAISRATGKPVESLYATDSKKILAVTWGYPEDLGVLEIMDLRGSIALQELSCVSEGMGGRPIAIAHIDAPQPQPYRGVAQFREQDFDKLYHTIETLLE
jgi:hypothetical protein